MKAGNNSRNTTRSLKPSSHPLTQLQTPCKANFYVEIVTFVKVTELLIELFRNSALFLDSMCLFFESLSGLVFPERVLSMLQCDTQFVFLSQV